LREILSKT